MSDKFIQLRQEAEKYLRKIDTDISEFSDEDLKKIFHDLEVHQIELEMQNDELIKTKEVLEQTKEKYLNLFEFAPVGYLILSESNKIEEVNFTFCKLTGFNKQDILNKPFSNLIHPDFQDTFYLKFRQAIINQKPVSAEIQITTYHKEQIWIKLEIIRQHKSNNYLLSITNIEELKEAENSLLQLSSELKRLNADKDQFMRILAHDLRSPFNSLLGLSDLLITNLHKFDIEKTEELLNMLASTAQNTFSLLEDLLLWSKSQSGILAMQPQPFVFIDICEEVLVLMRVVANEKNITLNCSEQEIIEVFVDESMFKTILRNLISNAIKYSNTNGQVSIFAEKDNENVTITVSDNGVGIDNENISNLFEFTNEHTTKGTAGESGTGFGLTLCKEFVEKHGGK